IEKRRLARQQVDANRARLHHHVAGGIREGQDRHAASCRRTNRTGLRGHGVQPQGLSRPDAERRGLDRGGGAGGALGSSSLSGHISDQNRNEQLRESSRKRFGTTSRDHGSSLV